MSVLMTRLLGCVVLAVCSTWNVHASYSPGDPEWDSEAEDADDVDGGGYLDSSKAAREPEDRVRNEG